MSIGSRIRQLRLAHKLSGEAFGALCDVTKGRVSQWESGHGLPSIETLIKLREQLPFSFDWLLQGEDTSVAYTTTDPRIVQLLQALEPAAGFFSPIQKSLHWVDIRGLGGIYWNRPWI